MVSKSVLLLLLSACLLNLTAAQTSSPAGQETAKAQDSGNDISGMYTFLREGEFVQVTVEDGKLSGYVSRFGDSDSDKGQFIEQFFDKTSLDGNRLGFNTQTVHGVWYDFKGTVAAPAGRKPSEEGFHVIKGTLVEHATDAKGTEKTMQRQVEFKSFPADVNQP